MKTVQQLLAEIKDLNNAKQYDEVIKNLPDDVLQNYKNADLYAEKAQAFYRLKQYEECNKAVTKTLEIDENNAKANNYKGNNHYDKKEFEEAIFAYKKAISANPEYANVYNGLGNAYKVLRQYDEAISSYEKAIDLDPSFVFPYNGLGNVYTDLYQYDKAIELCKKAINIDATYASGYYNLGRIYFILKDYSKALFNYKKSIELFDNESFYAKIAKRQINDIEKLLLVNNKSGSINNKIDKINDLVKQIKNLLLYDDICVTHYSSLVVMRSLILDKSPFRISEGSFLNDTSEGRELFKFLDFHHAIRSEKETVALPFSQKPFIGSFVPANKSNALSLWRMYGKENKEEAKGCAVTINRDAFLTGIVDSVIPKGTPAPANLTSEEFSFFYVAYRNDGTFIVPGIGADKQTELNTIMKQLKGNVSKFKGNDIKEQQKVQEILDRIAFLFKTAEYQYEQELRLVVNGEGFTKKVDKELNRVYIELVKINPMIEGITLGPKVERAEEIAAMFYYALDEELHYTMDGKKRPEIVISRLPFK